MDSQFKTLVVFSHATMIVMLMVTLFWLSNSWPNLLPGSPLPVQEQNQIINPSLNWPQS
ncbi:hypothetical protein [Acaryochloris marina]|nr:hypothetical protein [Acaryochloris marina]